MFRSMRLLLSLLVAVPVAVTGGARAEDDPLPEPAPVPAGVHGNAATALEQEQIALKSERRAIQSDADGLAADCSRVSRDDTARVESCRERRERVLRRLAQYQTSLKEYDEHRRSALAAERARLHDVRVRLTAKLEQIRHWRAGLASDERQFLALQLEVARGRLADVLGALPAVEILKGLSATERYASVVSPKVVARFEAGYEALKASVAAADLTAATTDAERTRKVLDGQLALRKALLAVPLSRLPARDSGRLWLEGTQKIYDGGAKLLGYGMARPEAEREDPASVRLARAELAAELGSIAFPPLAVGLAARSLVGRELDLHVIHGAVTALASALGANWSAEQHLLNQIQRLDQDIAVAERQ